MSQIQDRAPSCANSRQDRPKGCFQHQGSLRKPLPTLRPNSHAPHQKIHQSAQLDPRFVSPHGPAPGASGYAPQGHIDRYSHVPRLMQQNTPSIPDLRSILLRHQAQKGNHPNLAGYLNCFPISSGNDAMRQPRRQHTLHSTTKPSTPLGITPYHSVRYVIDILEIYKINPDMKAVAFSNKDTTMPWVPHRPNDSFSSESEGRDNPPRRTVGSDRRGLISNNHLTHTSSPANSGVTKRRHRTRRKPSLGLSDRKGKFSLILCDLSPKCIRLPPIQSIFQHLPFAQWPAHMQKSEPSLSL